MPDQNPREFAAASVNAAKDGANRLAAHPDGRLRDLTFDQAAAATQIHALTAIAAALLAIADAIGGPS